MGLDDAEANGEAIQAVEESIAIDSIALGSKNESSSLSGVSVLDEKEKSSDRIGEEVRVDSDPSTKENVRSGENESKPVEDGKSLAELVEPLDEKKLGDKVEENGDEALLESKDGAVEGTEMNAVDGPFPATAVKTDVREQGDPEGEFSQEVLDRDADPVNDELREVKSRDDDSGARLQEGDGIVAEIALSEGGGLLDASDAQVSLEETRNDEVKLEKPHEVDSAQVEDNNAVVIDAADSSRGQDIAFRDTARQVDDAATTEEEETGSVVVEAENTNTRDESLQDNDKGGIENAMSNQEAHEESHMEQKIEDQSAKVSQNESEMVAEETAPMDVGGNPENSRPKEDVGAAADVDTFASNPATTDVVAGSDSQEASDTIEKAVAVGEKNSTGDQAREGSATEDTPRGGIAAGNAEDTEQQSLLGGERELTVPDKEPVQVVGSIATPEVMEENGAKNDEKVPENNEAATSAEIPAEASTRENEAEGAKEKSDETSTETPVASTEETEADRIEETVSDQAAISSNNEKETASDDKKQIEETDGQESPEVADHEESREADVETSLEAPVVDKVVSINEKETADEEKIEDGQVQTISETVETPIAMEEVQEKADDGVKIEETVLGELDTPVETQEPAHTTSLDEPVPESDEPGKVADEERALDIQEPTPATVQAATLTPEEPAEKRPAQDPEENAAGLEETAGQATEVSHQTVDELAAESSGTPFTDEGTPVNDQVMAHEAGESTDAALIQALQNIEAPIEDSVEADIQPLEELVEAPKLELAGTEGQAMPESEPLITEDSAKVETVTSEGELPPPNQTSLHAEEEQQPVEAPDDGKTTPQSSAAVEPEQTDEDPTKVTQEKAAKAPTESTPVPETIDSSESIKDEQSVDQTTPVDFGEASTEEVNAPEASVTAEGAPAVQSTDSIDETVSEMPAEPETTTETIQESEEEKPVESVEPTQATSLDEPAAEPREIPEERALETHEPEPEEPTPIETLAENAAGLVETSGEETEILHQNVVESSETPMEESTKTPGIEETPAQAASTEDKVDEEVLAPEELSPVTEVPVEDSVKTLESIIKPVEVEVAETEEAGTEDQDQTMPESEPLITDDPAKEETVASEAQTSILEDTSLQAEEEQPVEEPKVIKTTPHDQEAMEPDPLEVKQDKAADLVKAATLRGDSTEEERKASVESSTTEELPAEEERLPETNMRPLEEPVEAPKVEAESEEVGTGGQARELLSREDPAEAESVEPEPVPAEVEEASLSAEEQEPAEEQMNIETDREKTPAGNEEASAVEQEQNEESPVEETAANEDLVLVEAPAEETVNEEKIGETVPNQVESLSERANEKEETGDDEVTTTDDKEIADDLVKVEETIPGAVETAKVIEGDVASSEEKDEAKVGETGEVIEAGVPSSEEVEGAGDEVKIEETVPGEEASKVMEQIEEVEPANDEEKIEHAVPDQVETTEVTGEIEVVDDKTATNEAGRDESTSEVISEEQEMHATVDSEEQPSKVEVLEGNLDGVNINEEPPRTSDDVQSETKLGADEAPLTHFEEVAGAEQLESEPLESVSIEDKGGNARDLIETEKPAEVDTTATALSDALESEDKVNQSEGDVSYSVEETGSELIGAGDVVDSTGDVAHEVATASEREIQDQASTTFSDEADATAVVKEPSSANEKANAEQGTSQIDGSPEEEKGEQDIDGEAEVLVVAKEPKIKPEADEELLTDAQGEIQIATLQEIQDGRGDAKLEKAVPATDNGDVVVSREEIAGEQVDGRVDSTADASESKGDEEMTTSDQEVDAALGDQTSATEFDVRDDEKEADAEVAEETPREAEPVIQAEDEDVLTSNKEVRAIETDGQGETKDEVPVDKEELTTTTTEQSGDSSESKQEDPGANEDQSVIEEQVSGGSCVEVAPLSVAVSEEQRAREDGATQETETVSAAEDQAAVEESIQSDQVPADKPDLGVLESQEPVTTDEATVEKDTVHDRGLEIQDVHDKEVAEEVEEKPETTEGEDSPAKVLEEVLETKEEAEKRGDNASGEEKEAIQNPVEGGRAEQGEEVFNDGKEPTTNLVEHKPSSEDKTVATTVPVAVDETATDEEIQAQIAEDSTVDKREEKLEVAETETEEEPAVPETQSPEDLSTSKEADELANINDETQVAETQAKDTTLDKEETHDEPDKEEVLVTVPDKEASEVEATVRETMLPESATAGDEKAVAVERHPAENYNKQEAEELQTTPVIEAERVPEDSTPAEDTVVIAPGGAALGAQPAEAQGEEEEERVAEDLTPAVAGEAQKEGKVKEAEEDPTPTEDEGDEKEEALEDEKEELTLNSDDSPEDASKTEKTQVIKEHEQEPGAANGDDLAAPPPAAAQTKRPENSPPPASMSIASALKSIVAALSTKPSKKKRLRLKKELAKELQEQAA